MAVLINYFFLGCLAAPPLLTGKWFPKDPVKTDKLAAAAAAAAAAATQRRKETKKAEETIAKQEERTIDTEIWILIKM
jgi:hypothetical protein